MFTYCIAVLRFPIISHSYMSVIFYIRPENGNCYFSPFMVRIVPALLSYPFCAGVVLKDNYHLLCGVISKITIVSISAKNVTSIKYDRFFSNIKKILSFRSDKIIIIRIIMYVSETRNFKSY